MQAQLYYHWWACPSGCGVFLGKNYVVPKKRLCPICKLELFFLLTSTESPVIYDSKNPPKTT
jgi:hypothetical protein